MRISILFFLAIAAFGIGAPATLAIVTDTTDNGTTQTSVTNTTQTQTSVTNTGNVTLINPLQGQTLMGLLNDILTIVIQIGTIVIILMIVYVGFLFVVAQGKDAEITKARSALLWTVIGALILLGAQGLSLGIQATVHALGG